MSRIARQDLLEHMVTKGWEAYEARDEDRLPDIAARGPVSELQVNSSYVTMCRTEYPRDARALSQEMEKRIGKGIFPLADDGLKTMSLAYFTVLQGGIACHAHNSGFLPYYEVHRLLRYLPSSNMDAAPTES